MNNLETPSNNHLQPVITAKNLTKLYKKKPALNNASFSIYPGQIVGFIGPNGAGKTTALKAILGLTDVFGELNVLGLNPKLQRNELMQEVCFIADVAILPRWLKVKDAVDFVAGIHPKFNRIKCQKFLERTQLAPNLRVKEMSKGMIVQLHLALIMAIDAKLLVLDEPTLGLDVLYRKEFYQRLLEDYYDAEKTIIITTHQVEEVEHILTDIIFIKQGGIVFSESMENIFPRFTQVLINPEKIDAARLLNPIEERQLPFGKIAMLFDGVALDQLENLGETGQPNLADLFVAIMKGTYA